MTSNHHFIPWLHRITFSWLHPMTSLYDFTIWLYHDFDIWLHLWLYPMTSFDDFIQWLHHDFTLWLEPINNYQLIYSSLQTHDFFKTSPYDFTLYEFSLQLHLTTFKAEVLWQYSNLSSKYFTPHLFSNYSKKSHKRCFETICQNRF